MSNKRLHVICRTEQDAHNWATENAIPWNRVTPVTAAVQLRAIATGTQLNCVVLAPAVVRMPDSVRAAIDTQLSIRDALGDITRITTEAALEPFRTRT